MQGGPRQNTMGVTLAFTTQETPELAHPVDSYRPCWCTHHPTPAQLILYGVQKSVVSGHRQSLQLTGLGKSLLLICQQQPRLNYKRRMYSAYMKDAP